MIESRENQQQQCKTKDLQKFKLFQRPRLPVGVRSKVYAYLEMDDLLQKVSILSKHERYNLLPENSLLDQILTARISLKQLHKMSYNLYHYSLRIANHVEIEMCKLDDFKRADDFMEALDDSMKYHEKRITVVLQSAKSFDEPTFLAVFSKNMKEIQEFKIYHEFCRLSDHENPLSKRCLVRDEIQLTEGENGQVQMNYTNNRSILPYLLCNDTENEDSAQVNSFQVEMFTKFLQSELRSVDANLVDPLQHFDKQRTSEVFYHRLFYMEAQKILRHLYSVGLFKGKTDHTYQLFKPGNDDKVKMQKQQKMTKLEMADFSVYLLADSPGSTGLVKKFMQYNTKNASPNKISDSII